MPAINDEQFSKLMGHYHGTFIQWHRHVTKYIRIERDVFLTDFQVVLFRTMTLFDVDKATAVDARFERYFMSSLRKMANTLMRRASSKKRRSERRHVSFQLRSHDIRDMRIDLDHETEIAEAIAQYTKGEDQSTVRLLASGADGGDVCRELGIDRPRFRSIMRRLRNNGPLIAACRSR